MFRTNAREYTIGGCYRSAAFHFVRLLPHANPTSSATFNWHVSSCTWLWARKTRSTSLPGIWVNVNFTNLKKIIVRENTLLPKHVGVKCNEVTIIHLEGNTYVSNWTPHNYITPVECLSVTPTVVAAQPMRPWYVT